METWAHSEISKCWGSGARALRGWIRHFLEVEIKKQRLCPLGSKVSMRRGLVGWTSGLGLKPSSGELSLDRLFVWVEIWGNFVFPQALLGVFI